MQIQTLSIVVPTPRCINDCKFCVSKMANGYEFINQIEKNTRFFDLYESDYKKRMEFARDNGCNTAILTGDGEPLQNKNFLKNFAHWNSMLKKPFQWIELQTTGVMLDEEALRFLRNTVGVTTISLSVSDIFNDKNNNDIIGTPPKYKINLNEVCAEIKRYDFNLRLSINLINIYNNVEFSDILHRIKELNADQVIFRKLYESDDTLPQTEWINNNSCNDAVISELNTIVKMLGVPLEILPFGATRYDLSGISTVIDDICMPQETTSSFRYLILRPNCKLYSRWDRKASLVF